MTVEDYQRLRARGFQLAGGLADLTQRACVYHHMYADSAGRNVFPLIAAHGALWASGYFKKGLLAGKIISLLHIFKPTLRQELLHSLNQFADKFRDINRQVCAESYAIYHYSRLHGDNAFLQSLIGAEFTEILSQCHHSRHTNSEFSRENREALFCAFFNWEQENIVAPSVCLAYEQFHWSIIKKLALQPNVKFAYFGFGNGLQFRDFSQKEERIRRGLQAYQRAEEVGLEYVERSIYLYQLMPQAFHDNPRAYFNSLEMAI